MLRRHEQYYSVILAEYVCYSREHNSAIMTKIKILFPNVQCMSELWCKFKMPASNTVGGVVETQTEYGVIWSKYFCYSTDIILQ